MPDEQPNAVSVLSAVADKGRTPGRALDRLSTRMRHIDLSRPEGGEAETSVTRGWRLSGKISPLRARGAPVEMTSWGAGAAARWSKEVRRLRTMKFGPRRPVPRGV